MYRTCLFCHGDLGDNGAIESFPIGRRLAFDERKGRLWIVCPACERWNLSPLEERWEAVEACERRFRAESLRAHTDQIGLARLREGTELIRVGEPVRQEFAVWRYGDQLGRRMRSALTRIGVGTVAVGALSGAAAATGIAGAALFPPALLAAGAWGSALYINMRGRLRWFRVPGEDGRAHTMFRADLRETTLRPADGEEGWILSLRHTAGWTELRGDAARRALGVVLPRVNRLGAGTGRVDDATALIEQHGGPDRLLASLAVESKRRSGDYLAQRADFRRHGQAPGGSWSPGRDLTGAPIDQGSLPQLGVAERLALEMSVHEESERWAMEHELRPLEVAWREAEEIAAIADRLTTPAEHERWIRERRGVSSTDEPPVDGG